MTRKQKIRVILEKLSSVKQEGINGKALFKEVLKNATDERINSIYKSYILEEETQQK